MKPFCAFLICASWLFAANTVPNRYIVELTNEPVAVHVARSPVHGPVRALIRGTAASRQRALIRAEQSSARREIQRRGGTVAGAVENVENALLVRIPDAQAAQLASIPGVRRVYPVRTFHLLLDHALPLHRVPDAWTQVGPANAGAGIKIGFIDTGVDIGHPGFVDAGFTAPSGFPVADTPADLAYTNNKVIVARSYASYFVNPDPDPSAADHVGHGTATAMAAAGILNTGPLATISGVAPEAYIGSYKVFGSPGVNDNASEDAILQAIDDAVVDGMDIINLSLGGDESPRLADDLEAQALENAAALGVIVVAAAGNNGPNPMTVASPGDAPDVIAVGASNNDRLFAASVLAPAGGAVMAQPGSGANSATPIAATLMDVSTLDQSGLACSALPRNSLANAIALIFRGNCTFESKLDNAQAAGAVGAIVYDNVQEDLVLMGVGAATLPAEFVSNSDGLSLKSQAGGQATLQFTLSPFYTDPATIAGFSAQGPTVDLAVKPDLLAVGENMYTATQKLDPQGELYSPDGYGVEQGTSFSAPLVAGAAALVKAARPGLTAAQYRSLLINSADPASSGPGVPATVQQGGAGLLDVLAAVNATAAVAPVSLSFNGSASQTLTLWNVDVAPDTFQISVVPTNGAPAPQLPYASVQLDTGASVSISVQFPTDGLAPGDYEGYIDIEGSHSGVTARIPYWYAVPSGRPQAITVLYNAGDNGPLPAGSRQSQAVDFRITDSSGLVVNSVQPVVTAISGGGRVMSVDSIDIVVPGAWSTTVRLGATPGDNVFQIQAGSVTATVTITGQ